MRPFLDTHLLLVLFRTGLVRLDVNPNYPMKETFSSIPEKTCSQDVQVSPTQAPKAPTHLIFHPSPKCLIFFVFACIIELSFYRS